MRRGIPIVPSAVGKRVSERGMNGAERGKRLLQLLRLTARVAHVFFFYFKTNDSLD